MTATDRKSYAVKAETFEQVLDILADVDKDVENLKASVDGLNECMTSLDSSINRLTKGLEDVRRIAIIATMTATGAVAFSAFSLYLR